MKKIISVILFVSLTIISLAQTLTPRVICSGYGSGQGGGVKLNYTVGETFITTLRSGNTVLTQGFHQPEITACPSAPIAANIPQDLTLECSSTIPDFDPAFYMPDGSAVVVVHTTSYETDGCTYYTYQQCIGINECNDSTVVSRTITQVDSTPPILLGCEGDVYYNDASQIPAPPVITAIDNCSDTVQVFYNDTCQGCTQEGAYSYELYTPQRPSDNVCNYPYDWAMALFSLPSIYRWYQLDTEVPAQIVYNPDGTITFSGRVFSATYPEGGFDFNVTYGAGKDWTEWSTDAIPSGFKADCGGVDENYTQWMYYIMQANASFELIGWGVFADSYLNLTHAPSNQYFGLQVGEGANNYNADFGAGGWFIYTGTFKYNGQLISGGASSGIGDFAFRMSETPNPITRTWTASDCAGNLASCTQQVIFDNCLGIAVGTPCDDHDACTVNDVTQSDCSCVGTIADADNDGTCDANDFCAGVEPGGACDDNNVCTVNDIIQSDCTCAGTFADGDNDGTCDANDLCEGPEAGTACDDNDACTVNDVIQSDCTCAGTFADADSDGICDANDLCAGPEAGTACDDDDPCTVNDLVQSDCTCVGTFADADNDGICDANDSCAGVEVGSECDDGNPCTLNDVIRIDCSCLGEEDVTPPTFAGAFSDTIIRVNPGLPLIQMPDGSGTGVWNTVNPDGVVTGGIVCSPEVCGFNGWAGNVWMGDTLIWNPIGANSMGRYYTNGFYVSPSGYYILPEGASEQGLTYTECYLNTEIQEPVANDNTDANPLVIYLGESIAPGDCEYIEFVRTKAWIAIDACGNVSDTVYKSQIVVTELSGPNFIFNTENQIDTIACNESYEVIAPVADTAFINTTQCSQYSISQEADTTYTQYSWEYNVDAEIRVVTWRITPGCREPWFFSKTYIILDTIAPTISEPGNDTVIYYPQEPVFTAPIASDQCGNAIVVQFSEFVEEFGCPGSYSKTLYWIAYDEKYNLSEEVSQTITVLRSICDDGNPCTSGDVYQEDCSCAGTFADADSDGICDANDLCAGPEPGSACDDANPCTIDDVVQSDCTCIGTAVEPETGEETVHACGPYLWNGSTYNASGHYQVTLHNALGCDSIATLHLTVGTPTFTNETATGCVSYTWNNTVYTQSGTYTSITTNASGCTNTATLNLTILQTAVPTFNAVGPYCRGASIPALPTTSINGISGGWSPAVDNTNTTIYTFTPISGQCATTAQLTITITPNVTPTFNAVGPYCSGASISALPTTSTNGITGSWSPAMNNTTTTTYTFTPNSGQCATATQLTIAINTNSVAPVSASASSTTVATNATVTLTVNGGSLGTGAQWKWYKNSCGGTLVGTGASINTLVTGTTTYFVRAEGTCNTTTCASVTVTMTGSICGPTGVTASATSICSGASTTLSVQGTLFTGGTWRWYAGGCGTGTSVGSGASLTVSPTTTTTYFVRSEGGSCGTTSCMSVTITVNTAPAIPQGIVLPAQLCRNAPAVISILNPIAGLSYFWQVPNGWTITGGQGTSSLSVMVGQGNGQIRVYAFNSCGNSKNFIRSVSPINCTRSAEFEETDLQLNVWPNPASDLVHFSCGETLPDMLEIYDMMGKRLFSGSWIAEFDASTLASGIYFVRATSGGESVVTRMEIAR